MSTFGQVLVAFGIFATVMLVFVWALCRAAALADAPFDREQEPYLDDLEEKL